MIVVQIGVTFDTEMYFSKKKTHVRTAKEKLNLVSPKNLFSKPAARSR